MEVLSFHSWHLLIQSQQYKYQNNVWILFKTNTKDIVFIVNFEQLSFIVLVFPFTVNN